MKLSKRNVANIVVDWCSFVVLLGLVSTGALLFYRLPPGSGYRLFILGLSRHDWGDIHFWFGVSLAVLMLLHLVLHIGWIIRTFFSSDARWRNLLVAAMFLLLIVAAFIPFVLPVKDGSGMAVSTVASSGQILESGSHGKYGRGKGEGRGSRRGRVRESETH